ncbi:type II secretion system protein M [Roseateles amylovorans]|uniref:Type II secretion system protein M n=1 Tax=Roseateles amylovorans TaxID=2978473 RepID=A0ABY6B2K9_9BURK|nr:type II secretion system protein M [Roseateles amylovorans]UXH79316.1 type II secretion system protein M [Roseateles amylovorans]
MNSLTLWRRQFDERWQAAKPRERLMVRLAVVAVGALLLWLIALAPALSTLKKAPADMDRLDRELQQMRQLAEQTQQYRQIVPVSADQSIAALRTATERLGPAAELTVTGAQAQLRLRGVPGAALTSWLIEARQTARARPQQAELQTGAQGYSGRLTVLLPAAPGA